MKITHWNIHTQCGKIESKQKFICDLLGRWFDLPGEDSRKGSLLQLLNIQSSPWSNHCPPSLRRSWAHWDHQKGNCILMAGKTEAQGGTMDRLNAENQHTTIEAKLQVSYRNNSGDIQHRSLKSHRRDAHLQWQRHTLDPWRHGLIIHPAAAKTSSSYGVHVHCTTIPSTAAIEIWFSSTAVSWLVVLIQPLTWWFASHRHGVRR